MGEAAVRARRRRTSAIMWRHACAIGIALGLAITAAPVARASDAVERFTLPNGLRVVLERDARQPLVAVTVAYEVGSADDPLGYSELAHLTEPIIDLERDRGSCPPVRRACAVGAGRMLFTRGAEGTGNGRKGRAERYDREGRSERWTCKLKTKQSRFATQRSDMAERYRGWDLGVRLPEDIAILRLELGDHGLLVEIGPERENTILLTILFSRVEAFRSINESYRLRLWESEERPDPTMSTFVVEDSLWVRWLQEESRGVLDPERVTHYSIQTTEECLDVVTRGVPQIIMLTKRRGDGASSIG